MVVVFSACNLASASAISELNLALPFIVLALMLVPYANRKVGAT